MSNRRDIVFINNHTSFGFNTTEFLGEPLDEDGNRYIGVDEETKELEIEHFYNDKISYEEIRNIDPEFIAVSPGPGHPSNSEDVEVTGEIMQRGIEEYPIFGICMGMESMVYENGGEIGKALEPLHGKTSEIYHDGEGIFEDLEQGFEGGRYHSLVVDDVGPEFEVSAYAVDETEGEEEKVPMAVRHKKHPEVVGVQFHPESILTPKGNDLMENYYRMIYEE
jgi:anthranilate synthase component 2